MLLHTQRTNVLRTALAMNREGINHGSSGNVSARIGDGFLITPSALPYDKCRAGDMVQLSMEGQVVVGGRRPSSEWVLHRDIYAGRPEAGAVLHAHSPWCTTLACLEREIPPCHYMVAMAGGDSIPCAPYALFGSRELSENALAVLEGGRSACLLAHHGMVCFAPGLEEVLALAVEVENMARVFAQALQVEEPRRLSGLEMEAVQERFVGYKSVSLT